MSHLRAYTAGVESDEDGDGDRFDEHRVGSSVYYCGPQRRGFFVTEECDDVGRDDTYGGEGGGWTVSFQGAVATLLLDRVLWRRSAPWGPQSS